MKRFLCIFLSFLMLFSFVACNEDTTIGDSSSTTSDLLDNVATTAATTDVEEEATNKCDFYAGYARAKITPTEFPVCTGQGSHAYRVLEDIYATCVAFSDNKTTVLFITLDVQNIGPDFYNKATYKIKKATGIVKANVFISATHNHSAPHMSLKEETAMAWRDGVADTLAEISTQAIADLKPTIAYSGSVNTEGLSFVRRYLLEDGTYRSIGKLYEWSSTANEKAHESEADPQLQVLRFVREGAKDIVMANWQAHAAHAYSANTKAIAGDFIYYMREGVEKEHDVLFAYYQGAAGNINLTSSVHNVSGNYIKVGKSLVTYCSEALSNMKRVTLDKINVLTASPSARIRQDSPERLEAAIAINEGRDTGNVLRNKYKIEEYEASAIWARSIYLQGYPSGNYIINLSAISFGDISFVSAPYEMFDTNGMEVKSASPFKVTFICAYTNGSEDYIPSALAFSHGGYEAYKCLFEEGTGEILANKLIDMLKKLYEK